MHAAVKWLLALMAAGALSPIEAHCGPALPPSKPNIVLIVADDLGYGDLGCYGASRLKTPNLDRLAGQGLRFTQAYAPSSTCTPSRYALMTGEYGWRQPPRKTSILDGDAQLCIEPGRVTLPSLPKQAGYATGLIGKWHLGLGDGATPLDFNAAVGPGPLEVGFDAGRVGTLQAGGQHWKDMSGPDIMDLEEYMGHVRAIGAEPLVGINVEAAHKSGREEEGLNEAGSLIQHCVEKNYHVKYCRTTGHWLAASRLTRWVRRQLS